jgi:hypothetical protein
MPNTQSNNHAPTVLSDLAARIREAHERCHASLTQGLQHALEAGQLLIQAKERVPHGMWLTWLKSHTGIDERLAQRYMRVARDLPRLSQANTTRVSDLSFRQALTLISSNSQTARQLQKLPEEEQAKVFEGAAEHKVENLTEARQEYLSRRQHKRRQEKAGRAAATRRAQLEEEYPEAPVPQRPDLAELPDGEFEDVVRIRLAGLDERELQVVIEELERSGRWFNDLAQRLGQVYDPRLKQMCQHVVGAIFDLHKRLGYDRQALIDAVVGLRDLLRYWPHSGNEIVKWAKDAGISRGLLLLARKLLGVVITGQGVLAKTCQWTLPAAKRS